MAHAHSSLSSVVASFVKADDTRAFLILDGDGKIRFWNRGAVLLFGLSEVEATGSAFDRFLTSAEVQNNVLQSWRKLAGEGHRIDEEAWLKRGDGSEFLARLQVAHLDDDRMGLAVEDITTRRAAETALSDKELHLSSILATVPDAMVVIDELGNILSFSSAAERLFDYREAEVAGKNVKLLMTAENAQKHDDYIGHYVRTGERRIIGTGRVVIGRKRNGDEFPLELFVGETLSSGHRLFTGFIRDLSEQQQAELQLKQLQSELIHISRVSAMGTMASTLAHELNQPLTAIANYMEAGQMLVDAKDETGEMLREAMQESAKEALRAGSIVRRLREFVARGEVQQAPVSLSQLVHEAGQLALTGARERGVRAFFEMDADVDRVRVDRIQIQQVLVNLIRNAIEALDGCDQRDIVVSSHIENEELVRVSVADTGQGISPEIRARLFDAFNSSKPSGMGLGLSICRTIVEAHGGRVWASDRPGGGTIFSFTLPRAAERDEGVKDA